VSMVSRVSWASGMAPLEFDMMTTYAAVDERNSPRSYP
jgi:hypothetical protein